MKEERPRNPTAIEGNRSGKKHYGEPRRKFVRGTLGLRVGGKVSGGGNVSPYLESSNRSGTTKSNYCTRS